MVNRAQVKPKVIGVLEQVSGKVVNGDEKQALEGDLGLDVQSREALQPDFTEISTGFGGDVVGITECGKLEDVKAAIDLVTKRANMGGTGGSVG